MGKWRMTALGGAAAVLAAGGGALGAQLGGGWGGTLGGVSGLLAPLLVDLAIRGFDQDGGPPPGTDSPADAVPTQGAVGMMPIPLGLLEHPVRGRDDIVDALVAAVLNPGDQVHVVTAMGGVGKTTVAIEVARRVRAEGRPVWWITAGDQAEVEASMLALAEELGAPASQTERARAGERNGPDLVWAHLERAEGWLLVFDNADDPQVLARPGHPVAGGDGWMRPSRRGLVLVTSRRTVRGVWGGAAVVHELEVVDPDSAVQILLDLAPNAGGREGAEEVAQRLGALPLALHLAGVYLADPFTAAHRFSEYLQDLDRRFPELMAVRGEDGAIDRRRAVISTWEISLDDLERQGIPAARALLRLLSCYAPATAIPLDLLDPQIMSLAGMIPDRNGASMAPILRALGSLGLLRARLDDADSGRLVMHPLVTETQRHHLADAPNHGSVLRLAADLLLNATSRLDPRNPADWPAWHVLLPHTRSLISQVTVPETLAQAAHAANRLADALNESGVYPAAFALARHTLDHTVPVLGEDHSESLAARHAFARALLNEGDSASAEAQFRIVLERRQSVLGSEHPHTVASRHGLARALLHRWQLAAAEDEFRTVLEIRTRLLPEGHPHTITTRHHLAWVLLRRWELGTAEAEFRAVLDARRRSLGWEHPYTLDTQHGLAWVLLRRWELDEAEREWRMVLEARRRVLGELHPDTLETRHGLARLQLRRGELTTARTEFGQILAAYRHVLGDQHPETLDVRHNLARILLDLGRLPEAEAEFLAVDARRAEILGEEHPHTLATRHGLARLRLEGGDPVTAEAEFRRVLDARGRVLGERHPDTLDSRYHLARALVERRRAEPAEALFRQVLAAQEDVLGRHHPDTVTTRLALEDLRAPRHFRRRPRRR